MDNYILEGRTFRLAKNMKEWGEFMSPEGKDVHHRHVSADDFKVDGESWFYLSTVFLGVDHNFSLEDSDPIVFESMLFASNGDEEDMRRYRSWDEAVEGHLSLRKHITDRILKTVGESRISYEHKDKLTTINVTTKSKEYIPLDSNILRLIRES